MSDWLEILKIVKDAIGSLVGQERAEAAKTWDDVVLALDKLVVISAQHLNAIADVTAPLNENRDIVETAHRYSQLANNADFPRGYGEVRGVLEAARCLAPFTQTVAADYINSLLIELTKFQEAVFTLAWDSYRISDAFTKAAYVATNEDATVEMIELAAHPFVSTLADLFDQKAEFPKAGQLTTKHALVDVVRQWSIAWQRHVQDVLHRGRGLDFAIAKLRTQRGA